MNKSRQRRKGQSAIEYMILATTITIVVLVGFDEDQGFLVKSRNLAEGMLNEAIRGIMGTNSSVAARTDVDAHSGSRSYP